MADIDKLIGFMAIMQVPFRNDPDALMYIEEVKAALKTLKAQDPRVLTFEEVLITDHDVFCEFRYGMEVSRHSSEILKRWAIDAKYKYGQTWRCWTSRPTDEQRKAVKWA